MLGLVLIILRRHPFSVLELRRVGLGLALGPSLGLGLGFVRAHSSAPFVILIFP